MFASSWLVTGHFRNHFKDRNFRNALVTESLFWLNNFTSKASSWRVNVIFLDLETSIIAVHLSHLHSPRLLCTHRINMVTTFVYANNLHCTPHLVVLFETNLSLNKISTISFCHYPIFMQFCCIIFVTDCSQISSFIMTPSIYISKKMFFVKML